MADRTNPPAPITSPCCSDWTCEETMTRNEDLWPSDLGLGTVVTPVSILRTQAKLLGERTQGTLEGEVRTSTQGSDVYHDLNVVVPALGNYKYRLLKVHHAVTLYPVFVDEVTMPYGSIRANIPIETLDSRELKDEDALREWLRQTLVKQETTQILKNLYAQGTQRSSFRPVRSL